VNPSRFTKVGYTTEFSIEVMARLTVADSAGAVLSLWDVDTGDILAVPGPVVSDVLTTFITTFTLITPRRIALFCLSIAGGGTLYTSANVNVSYTTP